MVICRGQDRVGPAPGSRPGCARCILYRAPERIAMTADQQRQFPGWDERYQQQAVETMPWFYPELDDDLRQALDQRGLRSGSALDLGTGPGTQAMQLAQRGFTVTATDISEAAIRLARE